MAERNEKFWTPLEHQKFSHETAWFRDVVNVKEGEEFSCGGKLDGTMEKIVGCRTYLAGPMVDEFLEEIAKSIQNKLTFGKQTGLIAPISLFMPKQVMSSIAALAVTYKWDSLNECSRDVSEKKHSFTLTATSIVSLEGLFSPARFGGEYYLSKRSYSRSLVDGVQTSVFAGASKVVVTPQTPMKMVYNYHLKRLVITFYIQRHTADGGSVDSSLQALLNSPCE